MSGRLLLLCPVSVDLSCMLHKALLDCVQAVCAMDLNVRGRADRRGSTRKGTRPMHMNHVDRI